MFRGVSLPKVTQLVDASQEGILGNNKKLNQPKSNIHSAAESTRNVVLANTFVLQTHTKTHRNLTECLQTHLCYTPPTPTPHTPIPTHSFPYRSYPWPWPAAPLLYNSASSACYTVTQGTTQCLDELVICGRASPRGSFRGCPSQWPVTACFHDKVSFYHKQSTGPQEVDGRGMPQLQTLICVDGVRTASVEL